MWPSGAVPPRGSRPHDGVVVPSCRVHSLASSAAVRAGLTGLRSGPVRTHCYACGGLLEDRVDAGFNPLRPRWGSWCRLCLGWWPWVDEDGAPIDDQDRAAPYRLTDDPLTIDER
jgi:hypothetical protein